MPLREERTVLHPRIAAPQAIPILRAMIATAIYARTSEFIHTESSRRRVAKRAPPKPNAAIRSGFDAPRPNPCVGIKISPRLRRVARQPVQMPARNNTNASAGPTRLRSWRPIETLVGQPHASTLKSSSSIRCRSLRVSRAIGRTIQGTRTKHSRPSRSWRIVA